MRQRVSLGPICWGEGRLAPPTRNQLGRMRNTIFQPPIEARPPQKGQHRLVSRPPEARRNSPPPAPSSTARPRTLYRETEAGA